MSETVKALDANELEDIRKRERITKQAQDKGDWMGFRLSLGDAIRGKKVDNKFLKTL